MTKSANSVTKSANSVTKRADNATKTEEWSKKQCGNVTKFWVVFTQQVDALSLLELST